MLASQQIQAEIDQLEVALQPSNEELDALLTRFATDLMPHVETWLKDHVRRRVEEHAAQINAGGIEPLRAIKADLSELLSRLPAICTKAIGPKDQWPHRRKQSIGAGTGFDSGSGESYSAAIFRRAINPLGVLLSKHGLLTENPGSYGEWERGGPDQYKYKINPGFDERKFSVLQEYQSKRIQQGKQVDILAAKRQELEKARARELWDEA